MLVGVEQADAGRQAVDRAVCVAVEADAGARGESVVEDVEGGFEAVQCPAERCGELSAAERLGGLRGVRGARGDEGGQGCFDGRVVAGLVRVGPVACVGAGGEQLDGG